MLQAFLLGCIAFIGKCDLATGTNLIQRPIVLEIGRASCRERVSLR